MSELSRFRERMNTEPSPLDRMVAMIEATNTYAIAGSGDSREQLGVLLTTAIALFDQFHEADQHVALTLMFGMLIASQEGQSCEMDKEYLLSYEDRIRLFVAQVRVVAKESIADAAKAGFGVKPNA